MSVQQQGFFVEINKSFPEDWNLFLERFLDSYRSMARAVNGRDISIYDKEEILNGQKFFQDATFTLPSSSNILREAYRKTFNIADTFPGGLPPGGLALFPHGLVFPSPNTYHFTRIYGVIESLTIPRYVPIPNNDVHMEVGVVNIVVSGYPVTYDNYFGTLVIEYLKN